MVKNDRYRNSILGKIIHSRHYLIRIYYNKFIDACFLLFKGMTVFGVIAAQALCSRCRQLNDLVCIERHCMNIEETSVSSTQQKGSTTLFTDQSITTGHHFKPISPNKFHPSSNIQEGQQQSFTGNIGHKPFQSPGPVLPQPVLNPPQKISTDEQVHVPPSTGVKLPPKETQRVPADRESFVPLFEGPTKPQSGHIIEHSDLPVQPSFPSMPPVALPSNNVEGNMVQPPDNNVPQRGNDRTFRPIILPPRSQPSRVDSDNFQPQSTDSGSVVWGDNGSQRLPIEITKSELVGPIIQGIEPQQQQRDRINARPSNSNERNAVETVQNAGSVGTFVPIERISVFNDNQNIQQSETHDGAQGIPIEIGNIESFRPIPRDVEPHQQQQNRINIQPPNSNQRNAVETFLNSDVTGTSSSNEGIPMSSDNQNNHRPAPQEFIPFNAINEIPVEPRTDTVGPPNQEHVPGTDGRGVQTVLSDTVVQLPEETRANQEMQEQPPQSTNTGESNQANITQVFEEFFPIGFIESNNQITGPQNEDIPVANNIFAPFEASQSSATATGDGIHEGSHSQIVETGSQTASDIPTQADSASLNLQANSQQHIASNQEQGLSGVIPDDLTMLITSPFGVNPQELRDILAVRNTNFLNLGPGIPTTEPHITSTIGDSAPSFEIQNAAPGDHLPGDQPLQSNNDNVNSVVEFIDGGSNEGILFDSASNLPPEQSFETTTLMPTISPVRRQELSEISRQFLQGFRAKR